MTRPRLENHLINAERVNGFERLTNIDFIVLFGLNFSSIYHMPPDIRSFFGGKGSQASSQEQVLKKNNVCLFIYKVCVYTFNKTCLDESL